MLKKILHQALEKNHWEITEDIQQHLIRYLELLQQWNRTFNLTAIRDPQEMVYLHIMDSLSIQPYLQGSRLLDVGTGAGLPGIPLALTNPDRTWVLLDCNSKKTRFLTHIVHTLKLKNVEIVHSRCENYHPERLFDSIVSRAFAAIKVMLAATQHLIHPEGEFLAMKAAKLDTELADLPKGFKVTAVHPLVIKGLNAERCLICLKKE